MGIRGRPSRETEVLEPSEAGKGFGEVMYRTLPYSVVLQLEG